MNTEHKDGNFLDLRRNIAAMKSNMGRHESLFNRQAKLINFLGNETRVKIIYAVDREKSLSVKDLEKIMGVSSSVLSRHLSNMVKHEILMAEDRNGAVFYRIHQMAKELVLPIVGDIRARMVTESLVEHPDFWLINVIPD
jgi:DNA-binding transcriptional ArsR family regulator